SQVARPVPGRAAPQAVHRREQGQLEEGARLRLGCATLNHHARFGSTVATSCQLVGWSEAHKLAACGYAAACLLRLPARCFSGGSPEVLGFHGTAFQAVLSSRTVWKTVPRKPRLLQYPRAESPRLSIVVVVRPSRQ